MINSERKSKMNQDLIKLYSQMLMANYLEPFQLTISEFENQSVNDCYQQYLKTIKTGQPAFGPVQFRRSICQIYHFTTKIFRVTLIDEQGLKSHPSITKFIRKEIQNERTTLSSQ